jgi:hypothetical protein
MPITISGGERPGEFQILLDRQSALDIGAFVVDGLDISPGAAIPSDGDRRIDQALQGFFFTCGPDHIRHPEPIDGFDDGRRFPLHGSLCGTPVRRTEMSEANRLDVLRKSRSRLPMAERLWCRGVGRSARMDRRYSCRTG